LCYFTPVRYMPSALAVGTGIQRNDGARLQSPVSRFRNEISSVRTRNQRAIAALRFITVRLNAEMSRTAAIRLSDTEALGSPLQFPGFYPTGTEHRTSFHYFSFFSALVLSFSPNLFSLFCYIFDPLFVYFFVLSWKWSPPSFKNLAFNSICRRRLLIAHFFEIL
jgi:hypothetical protein